MANRARALGGGSLASCFGVGQRFKSQFFDGDCHHSASAVEELGWQSPTKSESPEGGNGEGETSGLSTNRNGFSRRAPTPPVAVLTVA